MAIIQLAKTPAPIRAAVPAPTARTAAPAPPAPAAPASAPAAGAGQVTDYPGHETQPIQPDTSQAAEEASKALARRAGSAIQSLFDVGANAAATIQALGPQSGLQVTPVTFQSIEQEGRWKPPNIISGETGRQFQLDQQNTNYENTATSSPGPDVLATPYGTAVRYNVKILTLTCPSLLANSPSKVVVDATYWSDGLEIWGDSAVWRTRKASPASSTTWRP